MRDHDRRGGGPTEVTAGKQVRCAGGCGRYVTKFELMAGDTAWVRRPGGWWCRSCGAGPTGNEKSDQ